MSAIDDVTAPVGPPDTGWEPYRTVLEKQRARCLEEARATAEALGQAPLDTVLRARRASVGSTLEQISQALERLTAGTFGACLRCGRAIPGERLEIRPYTPTCVACS
jgi:hypothetical protein